MPRLFVAIDLPEKLKESLGALPGQFEGARWIKPEQIHLTILFIGETNAASEIRSALSMVDGAPFELAVTGVGCFPEDARKAARVLWAGLTVPEAFILLREQVRSALTPLRLPPDPAPFAAHITLARIPRGSERTNRMARQFLSLNAGLHREPFPVNEFRLLESQQTATGSRYTVLDTYQRSV